MNAATISLDAIRNKNFANDCIFLSRKFIEVHLAGSRAACPEYGSQPVDRQNYRVNQHGAEGDRH